MRFKKYCGNKLQVLLVVSKKINTVLKQILTVVLITQFIKFDFFKLYLKIKIPIFILKNTSNCNVLHLKSYFSSQLLNIMSKK